MTDNVSSQAPLAEAHQHSSAQDRVNGTIMTAGFGSGSLLVDSNQVHGSGKQNGAQSSNQTFINKNSSQELQIKIPVD